MSRAARSFSDFVRIQASHTRLYNSSRSYLGGGLASAPSIFSRTRWAASIVRCGLNESGSGVNSVQSVSLSNKP